MYSLGGFIRTHVGDAVDEFFTCEFSMIQGPFRPYGDILRECLRRVMEGRGLRYDEDLGDALVLSFAKSPPFPDTVSSLIKVRRLGVKVGIISNTERRLVDITLSGIRHLVDSVVTAEDIGVYKPSPEAFRRALNILGVGVNDVVHVSAYLNYDIEPASRLGIRTIYVNRYGKPGIGPEIRDLTELPRALSAVLGGRER